MTQPSVKRVPVAAGVALNVLQWDQAADGTGAPVLLVHGLASNARLWEGVADELVASGHPVAALDLRGHGLSDKPDDGYDFVTFVGDLMSVVEALGWSRPFVVGQSFGGNVVLELAGRHPDAVRGLALVDGGTIELSERFADWPTCEAALAPPVLEGMPAERFASLIRSMHPDWPEAGVAATVANMEILADGTVRPWLTRARHLMILRALWEHHPSELYPLVTVPVSILVADDPANQRWMAGKRDGVARAEKALARASIHWIRGDHDLHAQHPVEVARLVHDASTASAPAGEGGS